MTGPPPPSITFERARALAEREARSLLEHSLTDATIPALREEYLEADHCWMFFRNRDIVIPPERSLTKAAFAVSKKGTVRVCLVQP